MTQTAHPTALCQDQRYIHVLGNGLWLEGKVSPWVFRFPRYPLQVQVTMRRGRGETLGTAFTVEHCLTTATATEYDVSRLLSSVRTIPCSRCAQPTFDPTTVITNQRGLCASCWLAVLDAKRAKLQAREKRRLARRDRRMKSRGMAVRVSARVHSELGDDYQADWYFPCRPASVLIRNLLRKEGSAVLDDFQIVTLE